MLGFDSVLNFRFHLASDDTDSSEIESLIQQRADAKKNKDFALADKIRADLLESGIILEDSREGTKWKKKVWYKQNLKIYDNIYKIIVEKVKN